MLQQRDLQKSQTLFAIPSKIMYYNEIVRYKLKIINITKSSGKTNQATYLFPRYLLPADHLCWTRMAISSWGHPGGCNGSLQVCSPH